MKFTRISTIERNYDGMDAQVMRLILQLLTSCVQIEQGRASLRKAGLTRSLNDLRVIMQKKQLVILEDLVHTIIDKLKISN